MLKKLNNTNLNIVIALVMLLTTFIGYLYVNNNFIASALWPAVGFAVGFYYAFGKKSLPGLINGILIADLIARFTLVDEQVYITILFSIVFTFSTIVQAHIYRRITFETSALSKLNFKKVVFFLIAAIGTSLIGAIISVSVILLADQCTDFLTTFSRWALGDLFGILIFGTAVTFSLLYDRKIFEARKIVILGLVYLAFFILFWINFF